MIQTCTVHGNGPGAPRALPSGAPYALPLTEARSSGLGLEWTPRSQMTQSAGLKAQGMLPQQGNTPTIAVNKSKPRGTARPAAGRGAGAIGAAMARHNAPPVASTRRMGQSPGTTQVPIASAVLNARQACITNNHTNIYAINETDSYCSLASSSSSDNG